MTISKKMPDGINLPKHVGIIMDGNGRWATKNNRERTYGHEQGAIVAEKVIEWTKEFNIEYLTLYTSFGGKLEKTKRRNRFFV